MEKNVYRNWKLKIAKPINFPKGGTEIVAKPKVNRRFNIFSDFLSKIVDEKMMKFLSKVQSYGRKLTGKRVSWKQKKNWKNEKAESQKRRISIVTEIKLESMENWK